MTPLKRDVLILKVKCFLWHSNRMYKSAHTHLAEFLLVLRHLLQHLGQIPHCGLFK